MAVGLIKSLAPKPDAASIATAVDDWLDDHPEATTTVQDGAISYAKLDSSLKGAADAVDAITDAHVSKNLYDAATCGPEDGKMYWNGAISSSTMYACTGKIPVDASTQYIFSAGTVLEKYVEFFSGATGGTFISRTITDGAAFTTPENCTYAAVMLFAQSHTTEEYNAAIAVAQLEKGSSATPYEPYGTAYSVPLDVVDAGDMSLSDMFTEYHGKNLYDKATCAHEDGMVYYNGAPAANSLYAVTGIIPVEENMLYTFNAGGVTVKQIVFFQGNTQKSASTLSTDPTAYTFTTPEGCDGVGFSIFAMSHTTEQYNAAINAAQLEQGNTATAYEAYQTDGTQNYSFIAQAVGPRVDKTISQAAMTGILNDPRRSSWWTDKKGDSLGDSITAKFDRFQKFVKAYVGLSEFYNNGMTGTKLAGPTDATWGDSMWMDSRINALHADADFVTILGGANDPATEEIGTVDISNSDTSTYAGAFNVVISKIYYRYLALSSGYYQNVDYGGVTKLSEPHNVVILPCTMFYVPGGIAKLSEKAEAIRKLSQAWGLRVVDFNAWAQSNPCVAGKYWTVSDNVHPTEDFYKERLAPLLISSLEWIRPITYVGV